MTHTTSENKVKLQTDKTIILAEKFSVETLFFCRNNNERTLRLPKLNVSLTVHHELTIQ